MKYRLGDLIEISEQRNTDNKYTEEDVRGISTQKVFIKTKANLSGVSLTSYKIVKHGDFAYVPDTSRRGNKISLSYNDTNKVIIVSSISIVFRVKSEKLLPEFLMMYFTRSEFDRYSRYNSWGSAREAFSWEDMCDIELDLPSSEVQQKYVDVYNSILENQKAFEKGAEDLKIVCDAYIEDLRNKQISKKLDKYIICTDKKSNSFNLEIKGISNQQKFISSESRTFGVNKEKYLLINRREFGYSPIHINEGSIAFNNLNNDFLLSPIYKTFKIVNEEELLSEYLMMWFARKEFKRYCWFYAFGSARDTFDWEQLCDFAIPIPSLEIQQDIVNIYEVYNKRKSIAEKLKKQIKNICPVLIAGAIKEGEKTNG